MAVTPNYDLDIDSTLGGDNASDYVIPSQKAIKSYVDNNSVIPSNMVTTDTAQNITGVKTFVGQKMIAFKQSTSSNKLGFTLYNNNNVEKGYLEFNPTNTIDGAPLMTLGNYATAAAGITHVGFRKYSSVSGASGAYNLLAPLISNAKTPFNLTTTYTNFYLPLGFTDGTTMVKTASSGVVDLSSILPDVSNFVTNSSLATTLTDYVTNSSLATTLTDYVTNSALTTTLADYQPLLTSGTNIKTINNTSVLGSGNISVGTVTSVNNTQPDASGNVSLTIPTVGNGTITINQGGTLKGTFTVNQSGNTTIDLDAGSSGSYADTDLSNLSATGQAKFQAPLGYTPANTNLSNLSTTGKAVIDGQWIDSQQSMISTAPSMGYNNNALEYRIDLPNDGHIYEVLVGGRISTGSTSGNFVYLTMRGNQDSYSRYCCGCRTRTSSTMLAMGTVIVTASYVASGSKNLYVPRTTDYTGTLDVLNVIAYRRIGTNS